jgi:hypothetical protein
MQTIVCSQAFPHQEFFLYSVWVSMGLDSKQISQLHGILDNLISATLSTSNHLAPTNCLITFTLPLDILPKLKSVWQKWRHSTMSLETFRNQRKEFNNAQNAYTTSHYPPQYRDEVNYYIEHGTLKLEGKWSQVVKKRAHLNPTFLHLSFDTCVVHYNSNPYPLFTLTHWNEKRSLLENHMEIVADFVSSFKQGCNKISITCWLADVCDNAVFDMPPQLTFDAIHTSNLEDHVGLFNILLCCADRLKDERSLLITESLKTALRGNTLKDYITSYMEGIDLQLLPSLLGIRVSSNVDLEDKATVGQPDVFYWKRTPILSTSVLFEPEGTTT